MGAALGIFNFANERILNGCVFFSPFSANNEAQSGAASGIMRDTPSSTVAPGLFLNESHYKLWAGFKKGSPDVLWQFI